MKEKILSIVPEAILEEKHGIWFVSVPRTSFHDLALRLRNDEDTSFDFLVCMTGMDWGETLGRHVPSEIQQIRSRPGLTG